MQATKSKIVGDVKEFCSLYKINIPIESEFEYYIETLKKSDEYKHTLDETIMLFLDLELRVKDEGYETVRDYKNECFGKLKNYILASQSYKRLQEANLPGTKLFSKDNLNMVGEGEYLLSLDFKSANYSVLKTFDGETELGVNWIDLCSKFNVHPALVKSKSFRQLIFGNTNPKRLQTFQHENMLKVVDGLKLFGCIESDFVFISHDEVIIKVQSAVEALNIVKSIDYLSMDANNMSLRATVFSLSKIKKNTFVKTVYDIKAVKGITFEEAYKTLHGAPGHKFYMYFKKYIINEPIEDNDLLYYNDGELCKWIDEDARLVKKEKVRLPHYDKPKNIVFMKEAKEESSYLWGEMTRLLPSLSDEEKRRIIEIMANTCGYCGQAPVGCKCWNHE